MSSLDKVGRRNAKLARVAEVFGPGKIIPADRTVEFLEIVLSAGDRVVHEGDNQKQGDFLAEKLAQMDPKKVHGLKLALSCIGLPEHLDLFENGIAEEVDFAYAGPQGARLAQLVGNGTVKIGAVHTYVELIARYFGELRPTLPASFASKPTRPGISIPARTPRRRQLSSRPQRSAAESWSCRRIP